MSNTSMPPDLVAQNPEVYYSRDAVVLCGPAQIEFLKRRSLENPRKRARICAHPSAQDGLHEMLIVHHRDVYVRPHWHIGKSESLHVIEGSARALLFDQDGTVRQVVEIGDPASGRTFFYRIAEQRCHALIIDSEWLVFHEVTSGPFLPEQTRFPDWAPVVDDAAGVAALHARLP